MTIDIKSKIKLNDGNEMPIFGLGCYLIQSEDIETSVRSAIDNGYILIDTASIYKNEEAIGNALEKIFKEGKIKREDLFITTKANSAEHGYENAIQALENSLKKLKLDYVDLYLIHWPGVKGLDPSDNENSVIRKETWKAFEHFKTIGKCRSIGVSNYTVKHLQELLNHCSIKPAINQVECHPFFPQKELNQLCKSNGIVLEAYASLTRGQKLNENIIVEITKSHPGKTNSQILLRWAIQSGYIIIPKSTNPDRIKENSQIFDFQLTNEEMEKLNGIDEKDHVKICGSTKDCVHVY